MPLCSSLLGNRAHETSEKQTNKSFIFNLLFSGVCFLSADTELEELCGKHSFAAMGLIGDESTGPNLLVSRGISSCWRTLKLYFLKRFCLKLHHIDIR